MLLNFSHAPFLIPKLVCSFKSRAALLTIESARQVAQDGNKHADYSAGRFLFYTCEQAAILYTIRIYATLELKPHVFSIYNATATLLRHADTFWLPFLVNLSNETIHAACKSCDWSN